ncbi:NAD(P)-binding protein [Podospora fimiseda]|uniref:NAD(P)-binding protein n=1 Tax=Podospora fimiseda TaxID=252190 RepID=A0AAN7BYG0_9PEZI|nr:NAD(P)-binding protein [Podospora fimiseda]
MAPKFPSVSLRNTFIKTLHKKPYPSISPSLPELSQSDRTVVIAGGSTGIGFAIARAFVQAKAKKLILLGRRETVLYDAIAKLKTEEDTKDTILEGRACDIANLKETQKLWTEFKAEGIEVDVLVMNAAVTGDSTAILKAGFEKTWGVFEVNVRALLDFAGWFYQQNEESKKFFVNVSSSAIHNLKTESAAIPAYGLTKNAGTLLLQQIARDTDVGEMQIVSFHPGAVLTEMARDNGFDEDMMEWDDENLAGQFAVWAASDKARPLHGRFLTVHWDVDEITSSEALQAIDADDHHLKIGVIGVDGDH